MIHRVAYKLFGIFWLFISLGTRLALSWSIEDRQRTIQAHMRLVCRLLGIRLHFEGVHMRKSPRLLIANHVSYIDIFVIAALFPTSFLAKAELRSWPILSWLIRSADTIFVDRSSVLSRVRALREIRSSERGKNVCIFPEGTTTHARRPLRSSWHRGYAYLASRIDSPIYCLGLFYQDQKELAWVGDDSLLPHLLRICARKRIDVYVAAEPQQFNAFETHQEFVESTFKRVVQLTDKAGSFARCRAQAEPLANEVSGLADLLS